MHRLHRPLKPNIPYNKKNPLFKRRLRSYVQPPFLLLRFRIELLLQLKFSLSPPLVKRQVWKIRRFSRPVNKQ